MAGVYAINRHSPEPLGSMARAMDVAMIEANRRHGFAGDCDYRDLDDKALRDKIHAEVIARTRSLLGQE